jgi:hypothetical protein
MHIIYIKNYYFSNTFLKFICSMIFLGRFRREFVIMVLLKISLKKEQKKFTEMSIEKDCHI